jgi:hypothetical protein
MFRRSRRLLVLLFIVALLIAGVFVFSKLTRPAEEHLCSMATDYISWNNATSMPTEAQRLASAEATSDRDCGLQEAP